MSLIMSLVLLWVIVAIFCMVSAIGQDRGAALWFVLGLVGGPYTLIILVATDPKRP